MTQAPSLVDIHTDEGTEAMSVVAVKQIISRRRVDPETVSNLGRPHHRQAWTPFYALHFGT